MTLETSRLLLKPLTHDQLLKYIKDDGSLEKELNLAPGSKAIAAGLKQTLYENILPNVSDQNKDYLYQTLWMIISKSDRKITGDLCFAGEPDLDGAVEIGYRTYEAFRDKGFMTEAVKRMVEWVKEQAGIKNILASTAVDNIASCSILESNNFIKIAKGEGMFTWKLKLK